MMHAQTVGQYEALVRWIHVPMWVLIVSFVAFVRLYLHAGRPWLAWSICGLRTLVLILNFIFTPNLNFPANYRYPPLFVVGRRDRLGADRRGESVGPA